MCKWEKVRAEGFTKENGCAIIRLELRKLNLNAFDDRSLRGSRFVFGGKAGRVVEIGDGCCDKLGFMGETPHPSLRDTLLAAVRVGKSKIYF